MTRERYQVGQEIWEVEADLREGRLEVKREETRVEAGHPGSHGSSAIVTFNGRRLKTTLIQEKDDIYVHLDGHVIHLKKFVGSAEEAASTTSFDGKVKPPMPGNVVKVLVTAGDKVEKGAALVIIESMKMEHPVTAPVDGEVLAVNVSEGDLADHDCVMVEMDVPEE